MRPFIRATLTAAVAVGVLAFSGGAASAETEQHCPNHDGHPGKVNSTESGFDAYASGGTVTFPAGTVFCVKSSNEASGSRTSTGAPYTFNNHDVSYFIVYSTPKPDDEVKYTEWVDGDWECDDTTVTQTRTKTVYSYTLVDRKWVKGEGVSTTETGTRDLTDEEFESCPTTATTVVDDTTTTTVAGETTTTVAEDTTTTATVQAGGPTPPAAPPVGGAAPVQAAPVPTQLPSTGNSSWSLAMIALASLLGGLGLTKLARRTS